MSRFHAPIAEQIWDAKYRLKQADGTAIDETIESTWERIAHALAEAEEPTETESGQQLRARSKIRFYDALDNFQFLPAGRITAGAGAGRNVTLFNCLAGETLVLTAEYGLVRIGEIAGERVHVLDGGGEWVEAPINSFGEQAVAPVYLRGGYNGRERKTIRATAGHRWILQNGQEVTTNGLMSGHPLKRVVRADVVHDADYVDGVAHGIVYGDGTKRHELVDGSVSFGVRLCGGKVELAGALVAAGFTQSQPPSFGDDLLLYTHTFGRDLKALPAQTASRSYLTGFLRGWMATDGCVCHRDKRAMLSCGHDELVWLRSFGAVAGMEVNYATKLGDVTNFGARNKSVYNVSFTSWTLIPEDFLNSKHAQNFGTTADYPWIVESIGPYGDPEPVYCPRVVTTDSVQLDLGIHTGQCFVMGTIPDSMGGIFDMLKEAALTMQQGGGIGYDFSTLRPKGALVKGVAADASGPLTFMDCWDSMCRTVMSAGSRRGAMMATMRCDHPDIEEFITAKRDPLKLRMFNLSVLVTDEFMDAVRDGHNWRLHFEDRHGETLAEKTVNARELWDKIMRSTYNFAEPGVIFIDRINKTNNLWAQEVIASTNPCGEQPLPPYGACLLGSINLTTVIDNPFGPKATVNKARLNKLVATAIRMMDNVVDVSNFPLPQQKEEALNKRRLGLGMTGLADALIMLGLTYGSDEAVDFTEGVSEAIAIAAYSASVDLAIEKGPFPLFNGETYLRKGTLASTLPDDLKERIGKHGIRNSHLTSIAPTGTISLYAGNLSSGIEPVFALSYERKVLQKDGTKTVELVEDYALKAWREQGGGASFGELPPYFVTAQTLDPMDHVRMQAAAQKWVDSSISKTVNCPEDISFEDFKAIYQAAYDMGCKGCTTYRPNDVTGSVLTAVEPANEPEYPEGYQDHAAKALEREFPTEEPPMARPVELPGVVYKLKWPGSGHSLYITVTDVVDPATGQRRPFEVFINSKNMEHYAWTVALTRMISAIFRRPHDSRFVVEELKAVFDPKGGAWVDGAYVPSILAAIGGIIERHMRAIGYIERKIAVPKAMTAPYGEQQQHAGPHCPKCSSFNVKKESGCFVCKDCGDSTCG